MSLIFKKVYDRCIQDCRDENNIHDKMMPFYYRTNSKKIWMYISFNNYYRLYLKKQAKPGATLTYELFRDYFYSDPSVIESTPRSLFDLVRYVYRKEYEA